MNLLQSTTVSVRIGPFLDATDGVTPETALTLSAASIWVSVNELAFRLKSNSLACTAESLAAGWYSCPLDGTDTGNPGNMVLYAWTSGAAPVWHTYEVVAAKSEMDRLIANHRTAGTFGLYLSKGVPKNTAWADFCFAMVASSDHRTPKTGLTCGAFVSKDAAAFASIAGTITEVANGIYQMDAAAGDMNGDMLIFRFTGTAADDTFTTVKTS
jgi:hypothetical protein